MGYILGLSGRQGSGKTSLANYLVAGQHTLFPPRGKVVERYSPADLAKSVAMDLFGLSWEQVYGTREDREVLTEYFMGESIFPQHRDQAWDVKHSKPLTASEFMESWGSLIIEINCRGPIRHVLTQIGQAPPYLAVIDNVRRTWDVEEIQAAGGKVVRLTRDPYHSDSEWECALDGYQGFDATVCNHYPGTSLDRTQRALVETLQQWGWMP